MKKNFFNIALIAFFCLFLGCLNDDNIKVSKFTQKYLDFYNQESNVVIAIKFRDKDFLPEEVWEQALVLDEQKFIDKNLGEVVQYTWIIALKNNLFYDLKSMRDQNIEIFSGPLQSKEMLIIKNYSEAPSYFLTIRHKEDKNKENEENFDYISIDTSNLLKDFTYEHQVYFWSSYYKKSHKEIFNNESFLKRKERTETKPVYAKGEVDLDNDGKKEKIFFRGGTGTLEDGEEYEDIEEFKILFIDDKEYSSRDLIRIAQNEIDDSNWEFLVSDIEILDINPEDNYKEIIFKIETVAEEIVSAMVFHYVDEKLEFIGELQYGFEDFFSSSLNPETNTITIDTFDYNFLDFPYLHKKFYKLENNRIVSRTTIEDIKTPFGRIIGIVDLPINIYKNENSEELLFQAKKDDVLLFLETDHKTWVKVKDFNTGQTGYIRFYPSWGFYRQEELKNLYFNNVFYNLPMVG